MPIVFGVDLGTTKITALAVDSTTGDVQANRTAPNQAETTSTAGKAGGYSEWDARRIADQARVCLRALAEQLGDRRRELRGLGITGQQHGVVVVDDRLVPMTPLINWQDRRANALVPGCHRTYVQEAIERAGCDAPRRAGCRLAAGFMGVTLFWLKETGSLPSTGTACFLTDYFGALLTGQPPVTDATCAASSGLFNVSRGDWDDASIAALGLPSRIFPAIRPSGDFLGGVASPLAKATGLPAGLPVFLGIGDNQASFLGSVGDPTNAVLVNVGTGGQVAVFSEQFTNDPMLETRPFPRGGFLLVAAGLCGGASYAALERFYRQIGHAFFGASASDGLYTAMNRLAAEAPAGADGMRCEPLFAGTRAQPDLRATWSGVSVDNFTPAHITRALLEGMARTFRDGYDLMVRQTGQPRVRLVGAGNGLRENPVLAQIVADAFQMPMNSPRHREEAAYGAALLAAVGAGIFPNLTTAGQIIRYDIC